MPPVDAARAVTPLLPGDAAGSAAPPAPPSGDAPLADEIAACGSIAGVTVRLLASLPANLGQHLDAAA